MRHRLRRPSRLGRHGDVDVVEDDRLDVVRRADGDEGAVGCAGVVVSDSRARSGWRPRRRSDFLPRRSRTSCARRKRTTRTRRCVSTRPRVVARERARARERRITRRLTTERAVSRSVARRRAIQRRVRARGGSSILRSVRRGHSRRRTRAVPGADVARGDEDAGRGILRLDVSRRRRRSSRGARAVDAVSRERVR